MNDVAEAEEPSAPGAHISTSWDSFPVFSSVSMSIVVGFIFNLKKIYKNTNFLFRPRQLWVQSEYRFGYLEHKTDTGTPIFPYATYSTICIYYIHRTICYHFCIITFAT